MIYRLRGVIVGSLNSSARLLRQAEKAGAPFKTKSLSFSTMDKDLRDVRKPFIYEQPGLIGK